jgi:hypothetical protein
MNCCSSCLSLSESFDRSILFCSREEVGESMAMRFRGTGVRGNGVVKLYVLLTWSLVDQCFFEMRENDDGNPELSSRDVAW